MNEESASQMKANLACPSCGASPMGRFCGNCGEKRLTGHGHSVGHYIAETFEIVSHLDSKALRSLWLLVSRPGALSAAYLSGRRVRYLTPLRLFLLLSIVYYFSNAVFPYNAFTTPLAVQLHMNNYYPSYAAEQVERKMQRENIAYDALERRYDEKTAVFSKTLVFSLIPVIALLFYAVLFRKKKYFAEHLVVATHFWSFALLVIGIFIPILLLSLTWAADVSGLSPSYVTADFVPSTIIQVIFAIYLYMMLRHAYGASRWYGGLLAVLIAWSFFHIVWLFRFLLFVTTLRFI